MNYFTILKLQRIYGYRSMQNLISNGRIWHMNDDMKQKAIQMLDEGACMFPKVIHKDELGRYVAARQMMKPDERGSFQNSVKFYSKLKNLKK